MTNIKRRLQSLECAILPIALEAEVAEYMASDHIQEQITEAADRYQVDRNTLEAGMRKNEIRVRQIGWNAYYREVAADLGLPLEMVTDPDARSEILERLEAGDTDYWDSIRSEQSYWYKGIEYRGGKRVTPA